jgi:hypothetical protein
VQHCLEDQQIDQASNPQSKNSMARGTEQEPHPPVQLALKNRWKLEDWNKFKLLDLVQDKTGSLGKTASAHDQKYVYSFISRISTKK